MQPATSNIEICNDPTTANINTNGSNIGIEAITNEATAIIKSITEEISTFEHLRKVKAAIQPIDFREKAGLTDPRDKLKIVHYLVISIEEIEAKAKTLGTPIAVIKGLFFIYDKSYWREVAGADFKQFLGECAERLGLDEFAARYHDIREQLLKQALSALHIPEKSKKAEGTKLNLSNGTLVVSKDGVELLAHNPEDLFTYKLKFGYSPNSSCPKFENFLNEVLPDRSLQNILAEFIGYVFVPNSVLKLEKVLILYGSGANGKSVFQEITRALLGSENISEHTLEQLTEPNGYCRADLFGKLLNYSPEISGKIGSSGIFKSLVSGEAITVRRIYKDPFLIDEYARLAFNANELPRDVEQTNAFFRRFIIIPFEQNISPEKQDKRLVHKIVENELPGILNWVLAGLERLLKQEGFTDSSIVKSQIDEYRMDSDSVLSFLNEYNYAKSTDNKTQLKNIYQEYTEFSIGTGSHPCKLPTFSRRLKAAGFVMERASVGMIVYAKKEYNV